MINCCDECDCRFNYSMRCVEPGLRPCQHCGKLCNTLFSTTKPVDQISLEYNRNYGIDKRSGWTFVMNGGVEFQFEPWLIVALCRAFWRRFIRGPW